MSNSDELKRQQRYWNKTIVDFDAIYSHDKGRIGNWLDRFFRNDMYLRFNYTLEHAQPVAGKTFLDIGCGTGRYSIALAQENAGLVTGLDIAESMVAKSKELAAKAGVASHTQFLQGDLLGFTPERSYDCCIAIGLFDYIKAPLPVLQKMHSVIKEKAILSFPRLWTWRVPVRKIRLGLRGCAVYFYSRALLDRLLKEAGFSSYTCEVVGKLFCVTARK